MKSVIESLIKQALATLNLGEVSFVVEHPTDSKMGDYSTNVGIKTRKASEIVAELEKNLPKEIERVEVAGPGFINFYLSPEFFKNSLEEIIERGENFGRGTHAKGHKVMVEHTDPNPFKEFHIGHLMPNVIGSTIARIFEWNGAELKQANYQGDKGLHVAKAVWARLKNLDQFSKDSFGGVLPVFEYGRAYAVGNEAYENDDNARAEIEEINKKIYLMDDNIVYSSATPEGQYQDGRKRSLEYFEEIYKRLGAHFDYYFFESDTAPIGKQIVSENIGKVFEESEGAVVFRGEKFDPSLHTRVFINSQGIPTYEAKDLGNAKNKFDKYPYDLSVVVTGNEIKDYFRVMLKALEQIYPDLAKKTKHLPHGMLRLPTGKMSSRTGNVVTAESLIEEVKGRVGGNEVVAVGAIKYAILRQGIGQDIVFEFDKTISTEGDSGVYLQYAHARACSVLEKAGEVGGFEMGEVKGIEKILYRFPEIVERAGAEYAPNYITTYLTELASAFNNFYAHEPIIDNAHNLAITKAFKIVMKNGLQILGIGAPERM